jgi:hypothetical protein
VAFLLILDVLPSIGNRGGRRRSLVRYGDFTTWNPGGEHSGQYLRGLPALRSISNGSPHSAQHRCEHTASSYRLLQWVPLRGRETLWGAGHCGQLQKIRVSDFCADLTPFIVTLHRDDVAQRVRVRVVRIFPPNRPAVATLPERDLLASPQALNKEDIHARN